MVEAPLLGAHEEVLEGLWRAAGAGRLPHALLFEGPQGIGKFAAARRLAQGLFCRGGPARPCGRCDTCKKAASDNHLDLFVLDVAHEDVSEHKRDERIGIDRIGIDLNAPDLHVTRGRGRHHTATGSKLYFGTGQLSLLLLHVFLQVGRLLHHFHHVHGRSWF